MPDYQPKRSSKRWLEGAPAPVLACYDSGPNKGFDRYTVLYGAPLWTPDCGHEIPYVRMSEHPFHPQGFGQHGEMRSCDRSRLGKKIKFLDLPPDCQKLVEQDCREDETP